MTDGIQRFLAEAGECGCYAICLVKVAEKYKKKAVPKRVRHTSKH